nr:major histocompatibility complex class I-related gene protein-like [Misgurnus anguillicaudatus]
MWWKWNLLIAIGFFVHEHRAHCEQHFLQFQFSVISKRKTSSGQFYSAVGVCDDWQISHYCNEKWIWINLSADDWRSGPLEPHESKDWFLNLLHTLTNCTNSKCSVLHTLQRRIGCEVVKSSSGKVESQTAYDEYRFDGEDLIYLDTITMQWMDKTHGAKEIKMQWDMNTGRIEYLRSYLNQCMTWLSTYYSIKHPPKIHIFAVEAPHGGNKLNLTCMATGFYPKDLKMDITLNGIKLESLYSTGVRPNHDNTFQIRTSVEINKEDKDGLECHVTHSNQTLKTKWDGNCTNCNETSRKYAAVLVAVTAFIAAAVLVLMLRVYRMKNYQRNSQVTQQQQLNGVDSHASDLSETLIQLEQTNGIPANALQQ